MRCGSMANGSIPGPMIDNGRWPVMSGCRIIPTNKPCTIGGCASGQFFRAICQLHAADPPMTRPLQIGIIGCGNVLEAYVPECEKLKRRGLAELVLACGRPEQKERALHLGVPA